MAALVDVLAALCRKGMGDFKIGATRDRTLAGLTFREAYEKIEARTLFVDEGEFRSGSGPKGEFIVFRVEPNADPYRWLVERCTAEGEPY